MEGSTVLTQIDRVNAEEPKTFGTSLFTILARAINFVRRTTFHEPKLGRNENIIALSGSLEPLAHERFTVAIQT